MVLLLLMLYSIGVSAYLIYAKWVQTKPNALHNIWESVISKPNLSVEDLKAVAEIAKIRQSELPWYERSLSTIGIVAFFSMLLATGFQTVNSVKAEIDSSTLKQEISSLESQRKTWNKIIKELSEVIIQKATNDKLEKSEESVLRQRLLELDKIDKPDKEDEIERLKIYLALKEYDLASALVEKSKNLENGASSEDLIFLAEMSFLDGASARTRVLLQKFAEQLSKQPTDWQLRYYVLSAAMASDPKYYAGEVAILRHSTLEDATQWLERKIEELKTQARRRTASVENSQGQ
jgi:hypothetical protein